MLIAEKEELEASLAAMSAAREDETLALQDQHAQTVQQLAENAERSRADATDLRSRLSVLEEAQQQAELAKEAMMRAHECAISEARSTAILEKDGEHLALVESVRKDHETKLSSVREERDAAIALLQEQRRAELETLKEVRLVVFRLRASSLY